MFMRLQWNEGIEPIDAYASKVRSLGENLNVGQPMTKAAFMQGLLRRYQALVLGECGTLDSVVAYTSTLVASGLVKKLESVREATQSKGGASADHRQGRRLVFYACGKTGHYARDVLFPRCKEMKTGADNQHKSTEEDTFSNQSDAKKESQSTQARKESTSE